MMSKLACSSEANEVVDEARSAEEYRENVRALCPGYLIRKSLRYSAIRARVGASTRPTTLMMR